MKTKIRIIKSIVAAIIPVIILASCEDPKPADTSATGDTLQEHPVDTTKTTATPPDTLTPAKPDSLHGNK
jgi:hypothetical protein